MVGCSGIRTADGHYTVHAECLRIVGFAIPCDDQAKAASLVPEGATVLTEISTPADWTSVWGVLGNLLGLHYTFIAGDTK